MPDTGAPWNIPYVGTSDLVKDWPTDNQSQSEAIADALDVAFSIKQIVQSVADAQQTVSGGGMTDATDLDVTITPGATANKVLIIANVYASTNQIGALLQLVRDSTVIGSGTGGVIANGYAIIPYAGNTNQGANYPIVYLDSPATTSATTYKIQGNTTNGAGQWYVNRRAVDNNFSASSTITAIEVAL